MANAEQGANSSSSNDDSDNGNDIYCTLCKIGFSGIVPYNMHANGSKHKKAETKAHMKKKYDMKYKAAVEKLKDGKSADIQPSAPSKEEDGDDGTVFTCEVCKKVCTGYAPFQNHLTGSSHAKQIRKMKTIEYLKKRNQLPNKTVKSEDNAIFAMVPQLKPFATCDICNKEFTGPEHYHTHCTSKIHQKALQKKALIDDLAQKGVEINSKSDVNKDDESQRFLIFCNDCKKGFSGPIPYQQHMMSKAHKAQQEKTELMNRLLHKFPEMLKDSRNNEKTSSFSDSDSEDILLCIVCHMAFSGPESARDHFLSKKHEKAKKEKYKLDKFKKRQALVGQSSSVSENRENDQGFTIGQYQKPQSSTSTENSKSSQNSVDNQLVKPKLSSVTENSKKSQSFHIQTVKPNVENSKQGGNDSVSNEFVII